jgi:hypothetical protein
MKSLKRKQQNHIFFSSPTGHPSAACSTQQQESATSRPHTSLVHAARRNAFCIIIFSTKGFCQGPWPLFSIALKRGCPCSAAALSGKGQYAAYVCDGPMLHLQLRFFLSWWHIMSMLAAFFVCATKMAAVAAPERWLSSNKGMMPAGPCEPCSIRQISVIYVPVMPRHLLI